MKKTKIPKKDFEILESIKYEPGFERILWAYTGDKRRSHYLDSVGLVKLNNKLSNALDSLGLGFDRCMVYNNDETWIDPNLQCSDSFDYPTCCVKKMCDDISEPMDSVLKDHPYEGITSHFDYNEKRLSMFGQKKLTEFVQGYFKHLNDHGFDDNKHDYGFKGRSSKMKELVSKGDLPKRAYFLLMSCIPCESVCENMLKQTDDMYESLEMFGKDFADAVVEKYDIWMNSHENKEWSGYLKDSRKQYSNKEISLEELKLKLGKKHKEIFGVEYPY